MIIAVKGQYGHDEFIVCPRSPISVPALRERMLQRAKVRVGTYAFRLVEDLHAAIFQRSLDLKADYEEYFQVEYDSFDVYLRRRLRIDSAAVATLMKVVHESSGTFHVVSPYSFLTETFGPAFLQRLLEDETVMEPT